MKRSCENCLHRQHAEWSDIGYCPEYEKGHYDSARFCSSFEEHNWCKKDRKSLISQNLRNSKNSKELLELRRA